MANDFLAFAIDPLANVIDQTTYAALQAVQTGFQAGIAKSDEVNKAIRQSSVMSAIVARYIAAQTGADVLDDGDLAVLLVNFTSAITTGANIKPARIVTVSAPLSVQLADYAIGLRRTAGVAAMNVTLPAAQNGQEFEISDLSGNFNAFPITFVPPGGDDIAGGANFVANRDKQVVRFKRFVQGGNGFWSVTS